MTSKRSPSMLSLYRALLRLRRSEPALSIGNYVPVAATDRGLAYERRHRGRRLLVALNMSGETVDLPTEAATILLSTTLDGRREATSGRLLLRPHEGCIGACRGGPETQAGALQRRRLPVA
jgi:alpha-glucosidase